MNFFLIAICLFAGWILRATNVVAQDSHKGINSWILYIALPSVALLYIPGITWNAAMILPVTMPVVVLTGAWLGLKLISPGLRLDRGTAAAVLLTAGLGNTSFVGFPLTQAYYGDDGLRVAVVCDQITFLMLSTLGVMTAIHASSGGQSNARTIFLNIIRFPSVIAFVAALTLPHFVDMQLLEPLLGTFAGTLVPLALFSVGMQLSIADWRGEVKSLSVGLTYKLLLAPALVLTLAIGAAWKGIVPQATVFESAMPPMITSAILASEYQLNAKLCNLMVSVGILLAFATTALWWWIGQLLL